MDTTGSVQPTLPVQHEPQLVHGPFQHHHFALLPSMECLHSVWTVIASMQCAYISTYITVYHTSSQMLTSAPFCSSNSTIDVSSLSEAM